MAGNTDAGCKPNKPIFLAEKAGGKVVLFGTLHIGSKRTFQVTQDFSEKWLHNATVMYTETGLPIGKQQSSFLKRAQELGLAVDILRADNALFKKWHSLLGAGLKEIPTWSFFTLLTNQTMLMNAGTEPDIGQYPAVETLLHQEATRWGVKQLAIETTEAIDVIGSFSHAAMNDYARAMSTPYADISRGITKPYIAISMDKFIDLWATGNVDQLARLSESSELRLLNGQAQPLWTQFISRRNTKMAERIASEIAQAKSQDIPVVAVGVLHLGGRDGLLSLLKARGFSITCN